MPELPEVEIVKQSLNKNIKSKIPLILLHCTNIYPTPNELVRLNCLTELKKNGLKRTKQIRVPMRICMQGDTFKTQRLTKSGPIWAYF